MSENKIECPLCGGTGTNGDHECPECEGTGRVPDIFAELRHGRYETDEETAAAECRPLAEVQAERAQRVLALPAIGRTATITNTLIERVAADAVDLCEWQGDQWITVQRDITREHAAAAGFNLDAPAVQAVFEGL